MRKYLGFRSVLFVFTILLLVMMSVPIPAVAQATSGTISGVVTDEQGHPIANLSVDVMDYTTNRILSPGVITGQDGRYTLVVPAGTYLVRAWPSWSNGLLPYADEFYNETYNHDLAASVTVSPGQTIANVNFSLAPGGSISGTVKDQVTALPLAYLSVQAVQGNLGVGALTAQNGNYTIYGLHFGAHLVSAPAAPRFGPNDDSYMIQYYNNNNILTANLVPISSIAPNATGINFNLVKGTWSISGTIEDAATHQLITNNYGCVVITDTTVPLPQFVQLANIDTNGHYTIYGDSVGDYVLQAIVPDYMIQYYNGHLHSYETDIIHLVPGDHLTINFSLNYGAGSISGKVYGPDGVTPLPIGVVQAYDADTGWPAVGALANTNTNGVYRIGSLQGQGYQQ
jgi:hypothetical protein